MALLGPTTNHEQIRGWAESRGGSPAEMLPFRVNHEPLELRLYFGSDLDNEKWLRAMTWEDFFGRFDLMGLTFVYDDDPTLNPHNCYQILQEESRSPYRFTASHA